MLLPLGRICQNEQTGTVSATSPCRSSPVCLSEPEHTGHREHKGFYTSLCNSSNEGFPFIAAEHSGSNLKHSVRLKRGGQCSPKLVCAEVRDWWRRPVDALLYCSSQLRASSPELSSAPTMVSFWERGAGCQQRPQGLFAPAPPQVRGLET